MICFSVSQVFHGLSMICLLQNVCPARAEVEGAGQLPIRSHLLIFYRLVCLRSCTLMEFFTGNFPFLPPRAVSIFVTNCVGKVLSDTVTGRDHRSDGSPQPSSPPQKVIPRGNLLLKQIFFVHFSAFKFSILSNFELTYACNYIQCS